MPASEPRAQRGTIATAAVYLRMDVFDRLAAERGATTEVGRARLIGVNRATIRRMRRREFCPRMDIAMRMADLLGTTVDDLFEQAAA